MRRSFDATTKASTCWLMMFAAVLASTVRCCGMRGGMGSAMLRVTMCCFGMAACYYMATPAIRRIAAPVPTAADISSSSGALKAMFAPAVAVAPVRPRTHAQEDTVIEIARPIETTGRAAVRCIVVIAVGTDRLNADAHVDANLCTGGWRQAQGDEQGCRAGQKQTAHGELMSPARHSFDLPHVLSSRTSALSIHAFEPKPDSSSIGFGLLDRWSIRTVGRNGRVLGVVAGPKRE